MGDFNTHHSSWHATSTDTRVKNLADSICNSDFGILNWDTPTRLPSNATPSSPDVSLASSSLITSTNWNTITTLDSDHLPILIRLQTTVSVTPASHRTYVNLKKANWASLHRKSKTNWAIDRYPLTARRTRRPCELLFSKQRHTTSQLEDTRSTLNLCQLRSWN